MVLLYYHNESTAYLKCHQNNSGLISMGAKAKQRFGVHVRRFGGGGLVHTWHWGEPNHKLAEILTNRRGVGDVPGVTHLGLVGI